MESPSIPESVYPENPREAIKDGSTGIFCLSITCQYGLLTVHSLCSRTQLGLKTLIEWSGKF